MIRNLIVLFVTFIAALLPLSADPHNHLAVASDSLVDTSRQTSEEAYYRFRLDSMEMARLERMDSVTTPKDIIPFMALLIPIMAIILGSIIGMRALEARRAERLAMIERGVDASMFTPPAEELRKYRALRQGMTWGGLGAGLLAGTLFSNNIPLNRPDSEELIMLGAALLGAGLGLLAYYILVRRLERKDS
ncbi:MAG: hypothetical protein MUC47_03065 [Candidatus Kapabacteria bacterium]|jgi:hypothetical protein|nr:hypothetical protein [Candidatus Kapabacteria bacterium]